MSNKYLFYISQNYSFEILRPLQSVILARGDSCAWFVEGKSVNLENFSTKEKRLKTIQEAVDFQPAAVFVPGNVVPNFISGIKVQVFHGLEWKKKGHFSMRGFFDLYCTHGNITTTRFNRLAEKLRYFSVVETGWPKLDPLFQTVPFPLTSTRPVVLFAPTFSPNLTCAVSCFDTIKKLSQSGEYHWLVKFHPKMNQEWVRMYQGLESEFFQVVEIDSCLPLLQRADVLLSDTSSIISEFLLLGKPAVTYQNAKPGEYLIDIQSTEQLKPALEKALQGSDSLVEAIKAENAQLHPYSDGQSSVRILDAVDQMTANPPSLRNKKPLNLLRSFKLRKKLGYWKL
jgi:CDP-glycerol glycerophosphotransferase (TagB/SpsB family)